MVQRPRPPRPRPLCPRPGSCVLANSPAASGAGKPCSPTLSPRNRQSVSAVRLTPAAPSARKNLSIAFGRPRKQPKLSSPPRPGFAGRTHPAPIFHEKVRCDGSGRPASCLTAAFALPGRSLFHGLDSMHDPNAVGKRKITMSCGHPQPTRAQRAHEPGPGIGHQTGDGNPPPCSRHGLPLPPSRRETSGQTRHGVPVPR